MRDKILLPLKNEVMKIHVQLEPSKDANERWEKMLDFKLVFQEDQEFIFWFNAM